jgi:hypothetical protein
MTARSCFFTLSSFGGGGFGAAARNASSAARRRLPASLFSSRLFLAAERRLARASRQLGPDQLLEFIVDRLLRHAPEEAEDRAPDRRRRLAEERHEILHRRGSPCLLPMRPVRREASSRGSRSLC